MNNLVFIVQIIYKNIYLNLRYTNLDKLNKLDFVMRNPSNITILHNYTQTCVSRLHGIVLDNEQLVSIYWYKEFKQRKKKVKTSYNEGKMQNGINTFLDQV